MTKRCDKHQQRLAAIDAIMDKVRDRVRNYVRNVQSTDMQEQIWLEDVKEIARLAKGTRK